MELVGDVDRGNVVIEAPDQQHRMGQAVQVIAQVLPLCGAGDLEDAQGFVIVIHNVKNLSDPENFLVSYSLDFDEVAVLNEIMGEGGGFADLLNMPIGEPESENNNTPREFILKGKKFTTKGESKMPEPESEEDKMNMGLAMTMMQDASYKVVYSFERDVKKVKKNDNAIIGPDGKTVVMETNMADLLTGDADFNSQIKLK